MRSEITNTEKILRLYSKHSTKQAAFFPWLHCTDYGTLVPQPGIEPGPPAAKVLTTEPPGNYQESHFSYCSSHFPLTLKNIYNTFYKFLLHLKHRSNIYYSSDIIH